jgi:hypothetical protein
MVRRLYSEGTRLVMGAWTRRILQVDFGQQSSHSLHVKRHQGKLFQALREVRGRNMILHIRPKQASALKTVEEEICVLQDSGDELRIV